MSDKARTEKWGVGMPAMLYLEHFGSILWDAFGQPPYLVGSALIGITWRDVDVRIILDDEEYNSLFGCEKAKPERENVKWSAYCLAFSELGNRMTGLPIDFQVQRQSDANEQFKGPRSCLIFGRGKHLCDTNVQVPSDASITAAHIAPPLVPVAEEALGKITWVTFAGSKSFSHSKHGLLRIHQFNGFGVQGWVPQYQAKGTWVGLNDPRFPPQKTCVDMLRLLTEASEAITQKGKGC